MPEESFEQQARNMADDFRMEPQPAVWQQVQAAITEPKRRRGLLIWWWLLPLCLAGILTIILLEKNTFKRERVSVVKEKKLQETKSKIPSAYIPKKHEKDIVEINTTKSLHNTSGSYTKNNQSAFSLTRAGIKSLVKRNIKTIIPAEEKRSKPVTDLTRNLTTKQDNQASDSFSISVKKDSINLHDSSERTETSVVKTTDSLNKKTETTHSVTNIKKQKNKHWQLGILAEAGASYWGSNPFQNKSLPESFSSGSLNNVSNRINTIDRQVKNGKYISLGVAAHRKISKRIFISGQLAYRYQHFSITENIKVDSIITSPGNITSSAYYNLTEKQSSHFANVYTGIGWQFIKGKKFTVSAETGFDNSLLITVLEKKTNQTLLPDSLKNLSANRYYRWQPYIATSLSFDFYTGKTVHLQLSPLMRFGLRNFQKNNADYKDNHLVSTGIRAIYFFK